MFIDLVHPYYTDCYGFYLALFAVGQLFAMKIIIIDRDDNSLEGRIYLLLFPIFSTILMFLFITAHSFSLLFSPLPTFLFVIPFFLVRSSCISVCLVCVVLFFYRAMSKTALRNLNTLKQCIDAVITYAASARELMQNIRESLVRLQLSIYVLSSIWNTECPQRKKCCSN